MPKKKKTARTKRQALSDYEKRREAQEKLVLHLEKVTKQLKMSKFPSEPYRGCPPYTGCK
jgi:hypothetical protein